MAPSRTVRRAASKSPALAHGAAWRCGLASIANYSPVAMRMPGETCRQGVFCRIGQPPCRECWPVCSVALDPVGAGIDAELGRRAARAGAAACRAGSSPASRWAAARRARDSAAAALALGAGQMLPASGAAGQFAAHRAQYVAGRSRRLVLARRAASIGGGLGMVMRRRHAGGGGVWDFRTGIGARSGGAVVAGTAARSGWSRSAAAVAHVEGTDARARSRKQEDMQQRHQHPGDGARQRRRRCSAAPQRAGAGTQERVRQEQFRWPKLLNPSNASRPPTI